MPTTKQQQHKKLNTIQENHKLNNMKLKDGLWAFYTIRPEMDRANSTSTEDHDSTWTKNYSPFTKR